MFYFDWRVWAKCSSPACTSTELCLVCESEQAGDIDEVNLTWVVSTPWSIEMSVQTHLISLRKLTHQCLVRSQIWFENCYTSWKAHQRHKYQHQTRHWHQMCTRRWGRCRDVCQWSIYVRYGIRIRANLVSWLASFVVELSRAIPQGAFILKYVISKDYIPWIWARELTGWSWYAWYRPRQRTRHREKNEGS